MNNHLAEQSVIGGLLIDPSKLPDVLEYVTSSDFYDFKHQSYFKAIDALAEAKEPIDVTTVCVSSVDPSSTTIISKSPKVWSKTLPTASTTRLLLL